MNNKGYFSNRILAPVLFLKLGLGGVYFHGALLQGDKYNLLVARRSELQIIIDKKVTAIIPISARSLKAVRRACWQLSLRSKNFTFAFPVEEARWQKTNFKPLLFWG